MNNENKQLLFSGFSPFGSWCKTTILVASSLKPNKMKALFFPNLNTLYASMHEGSTLTPDDYFYFLKLKIRINILSTIFFEKKTFLIFTILFYFFLVSMLISS